MGNSPQYRTQKKEWFLDNTCAGGGKFKTLDKIHKPGGSIFGADTTARPGWKPLLVDLSTDGWTICDKVSVEGKQLRVVEMQECNSFGNLIAQYGYCLVTYASNKPLSHGLPIYCNSLFSFAMVLVYLDLQSLGKKDDCMEIAVQPLSPNAPKGSIKYLMKHNPTWKYQGRTKNGYAMYEIMAPRSAKSSLNTRILNNMSANPGNPSGIVTGPIGLVGLASFSLRNKEVLDVFHKETKWVIV